ncbi:MAG: hypothetical protein AAF823_07815 [Planctomycetota bacterium]
MRGITVYAAIAVLCLMTPLAHAQHRAVRIDLDPDHAFDNRVITFEWLKAQGEAVTPRSSINGPSMVYVPEHVPNRLGAYYLYFADHGGDHIKMAYADSPTGPFTLYRPNDGVLTLRDTADNTRLHERSGDRYIDFGNGLGVGSHIASPDVVYDEKAGRFQMIYHGVRFRRLEDGSWRNAGGRTQRSYAAWSQDGLDFNPGQYGIELGGPYARAFFYKGRGYLMTDHGSQQRPESPEGLYTEPYARPAKLGSDGRPRITLHDRIEAILRSDPGFIGRDPDFRHHAVGVEDDTLFWWFTLRREPQEVVDRIGSGEVIYEATVDLASEDWSRWNVTDLRLVLVPEHDFEGADLPAEVSLPSRPVEADGKTTRRVNELRDPGYFKDPISGRKFLYYGVAGEYGLAVAELLPTEGSHAAEEAP